MSTTFKKFTEALVKNHRGEDQETEFSYQPVRSLFVSALLDFMIKALADLRALTRKLI